MRRRRPAELLIAIGENLLARWPDLWPLARPWEHSDWPDAARYCATLMESAGGRDLDRLLVEAEP